MAPNEHSPGRWHGIGVAYPEHFGTIKCSEGSYTPRLLNAKGVLPGVFDVGAALHALWKYAQNRLVGNLRGK